MSRILVYTALTCRRSKLVDPPAVQGVDFVCFSDEAELPNAAVWNMRPMRRWLDCPIHTARWHKMFPHIHSPDYDFYVWVNANITPKRNILSTIERLPETVLVSAFFHRLRTDPMREAAFLKMNGLEDVDAIRWAVDRLTAAHYPVNGGLHETGILFLRNTTEVRTALEYWYDEMRVCNGVRDQLHFNRVMRAQDIPVKSISPGSVRKNEFTNWNMQPVPVTMETARLRESWLAKCR